MSSIDRRVVEMEFDNKQFEAGIRDTLKSLDALKEGLKLEGATKGLHEVGEAGKKFSLSGMAEAVENISSKFSILGAIGFTIIQDLTRSAMDFARKMANMVLDPLVAGGKRRAMNIEQAKFQFRGLGMDVEETMASALEAVTGTAYGLDEAAKVAGQLGASGMRAGDDMTSSLRAISGVAAMTSSSYEDIGNIFTKVAGNGRVMGDDLLRMSSRGLNAAATLADSLGISEQEVRSMVTEGQVSFEMFYRAMDDAFGENATKANETYTGSLANMRAALSRIGANFFTPWLEQQRDLFNALSPAIDSVGAALDPVIKALTTFTGKGTKRLINFINSLDFSDLDKVFTPLTRIAQQVFGMIGDLIQPIRDAFRQVFPPKSLADVGKALTSFQLFLARIKMGEETGERLRRTFAGFFAVLGIGWEILKAGISFFFELFGVVTKGSGAFLEGTASIGDFLVALHEAIKNGEGLKNFFDGLMGVLSPVIRLIRGFSEGIAEAFGASGDTSNLDGLVTAGERAAIAWSKVSEILSYVGDIVGRVARRIGEFLGQLPSKIAEYFSEVDWSFVLSTINTGLFAGFLVILNDLGNIFAGGTGRKIFSSITEMFDDLKGPIDGANKVLGQLTGTLSTMQNTLRATTLLQIAGAIGIMSWAVVSLSRVNGADLTRALGAMAALFVELGAGLMMIQIVGGLKGLFRTAIGITALAVALRILVTSVVALSKLDWRSLVKGLGGLAVVLGLVVASARGLSGASKGMISVGIGLTILAVGIRILASSVKSLADLSWEDLAKGLIGVGTLLASLVIFTQLVKVNKGGLAQGAGLVLLATGIRILASAVTAFSALSWGDIAKGLASIAAILAGFVIFSYVMGDSKGLMRAGASLILISVAMNVLALAMRSFAKMNWNDIGKGLAAMAGSLTLIVIALRTMPKNVIAKAAALVAVSVALNLVATALRIMGGMSWEQIARGLVALAGALLVLSVGLKMMSGTLLGSAALLVAAAALGVLAPILYLISGLGWGDIAKGLGLLAGVFLVLGVAGKLLAPTVPVFLGLAAAFLLLGGGVALLGVGIDLIVRAFTTLIKVGEDAAKVFGVLLDTVLTFIPALGTSLAEAFVSFMTALSDATDSLMEAVTRILLGLIQAGRDILPEAFGLFVDFLSEMLSAAVTLIPEMANAALDIMFGILAAINRRGPHILGAIIDIVVGMLKEMTSRVPDFVRAATELMVAFLTELAKNLDDVVTAGTNVIIALVESIGENSQRMIDAGFRTMIDFMNGVADSIDKNAPLMRQAGRNIGVSIINGMTGGLWDNESTVRTTAQNVAIGALNGAKRVLGMRSPSREFYKIGAWSTEGMANGLEKTAPVVERAAAHVGGGAIDTMKRSMMELSDIMMVDTDLSPTITPVLDLSKFRKDAASMDAVLPKSSIDIAAPYSKAVAVSDRQRANEVSSRVSEKVDVASTPAPVVYNQYNNSPKELSSADIYRQTRSHLSLMKGALKPDAAK